MFKRNLLTVLVATAAVGLGGFAINASAATGTGNATAVIVAPLTVSEAVGGSLNFGSVSPDETTGTTVIVTPAGLISSPGPIRAGLLGGGEQEGTFDVTGAALAYDITLPSAASTLTSGAFSMTVDNFTSNQASGTSADGDSFKVGATLNVGANQDPNGGVAYTGTYTVTVTYQ